MATSLSTWSTRILSGRLTSFGLNPKTAVRSLTIHEYQAQNLLKNAGAFVLQGGVAHSPEEAEQIVERIGSKCLIKPQILSTTDGNPLLKQYLKNGIPVANSPSTARTIATEIFARNSESSQSSHSTVDKLYVTKHIHYAEEFYLSLTIDRVSSSPMLLLSKNGGKSVEEIIESNPESLFRIHLDYFRGITPDIVTKVMFHLSLEVDAREKLQTLLFSLYDIFVAKDAVALEISRLARTEDGEFVCFDSKFSFDDAAGKRQPELFKMRDVSQEESSELEAEKAGLVYIRLDGDIGNVVNGAGLAMATNDAIAYYGGKSANFLDTGGQATVENMVTAFDIILKDERVKVILVNIYGGIIRCDMIADSVIAAAERLGPLRCPIVVRLQGTNAEEGQNLISQSGLNLISESKFGKAAQTAVRIAQSS